MVFKKNLLNLLHCSGEARTIINKFIQIAKDFVYGEND